MFSGAWSVRPDGGALAVSINTTAGRRIATIDLRTGQRAWTSPMDQNTLIGQLVWSKDGAWIYFGSGGAGSPDNKGTLYRVRPDGTELSALATLERFGSIGGLTANGDGLIWARGQAGGSVEIFDLATRTSRHLQDVAVVASMRARQPRAILSVGGCCAGSPGGSLALWDDVTLTSRVIAERGPAGSPAWGDASWDPSGTRVVAVRYDVDHRYPGVLTLIDPATGTTAPLAGGHLAFDVLWLDEGILYTVRAERGPEVELRLVPPTGGAAVTVFKGTEAYDIVVVRP
jgi:hypothetical protein